MWKRILAVTMGITTLLTGIPAYGTEINTDMVQQITVSGNDTGIDAADQKTDTVSQNTIPKEAVTGTDIDTIQEQECSAAFADDKTYSADLTAGSSYPAKYDPRDYGMVSEVRSQVGNLCWLYGTVSAMESNLIKRGLADNTIDLSELQILWFMYHKNEDPLGNYSDDVEDTTMEFRDILLEGGQAWEAVDAVSNWTGPILDSEASLDGVATNREYADKINSITLDPSLAAKNYWHFKGSRSTWYDIGETEEIKGLISEYGGVAAAYYDYGRYYYCGAENTDANYYAGEEKRKGSNHVIEIVGWDDNYDRNNYKGVYQDIPEHNGAWLVKENSKHNADKLGSNFGGYRTTGYMWLSYEYPITDIYALDFANKNEHENIYCYDGNTYVADGGSTGSAIERNVFMNIFKANAYEEKAVEKVDAIMVSIGRGNEYECTVYVNPVIRNGKLVSYTGKSGTVTGKTEQSGYYTIELPEPAYVTQGDTFAVCVKTNINRGIGLITSKQNPGECYVGTSLEDLHDSATDSKIIPYGGAAVPRVRGLTNKAEGITLSTSIVADQDGLSLTAGEKTSVSAQVYPESTTHRSYGCLSSNDSVATVTQDGQVTAVGAGSCSITITSYDGQSSTTIPVTVKAAPQVVSGQNGQTVQNTPAATTGTPKTTAIGTKFSVSGYTYKVTGKDTVTLTMGKNAKKATVPATVAKDGTTYKVTAISKNAFSGIKKLKSVVIGTNVKTIGNKAFYNCKSLKTVTVKGSGITKVGNSAFKKIADSAVIRVPKKCLAKFKKLVKKAVSATTKIK